MASAFDAGGRSTAAFLLLGRAAIAVLFIAAGYGKIFKGPAFAAAMAAKGMPFPELFPHLAVLIELLGGLVLLAGLKTRALALLFIAYTVFATLLVHNFWSMAEAQAYATNQLHFLKNCAIAGGFALLYVTGGGAWSLDALLRRNATLARRADAAG
ncbi:DoxX family protein [Bradyrhizobium manausense]